MATKRERTKFKSTASSYCYYSSKNKATTPGRKSLRKYDPTPTVRRHVEFKETK